MPAFERLELHAVPATRLTAPDGATALVTDRGAQVLSWIPAGGDERLYLSETAVYAPDTPIRGGVPVIFPQFGTLGALARHGFARTASWTLDESRAGADYALATWCLDSNPATRAIWPHEFRAELTVSVGGNQLDVELAIENTGTEPFEFTAALHSYLRVREVEHAKLTGLEHTEFRDQLAGGEVRTEARETLSFDGPIDRIHLDVPPRLVLSESGRQLLIESSGFPDVVIWNPWDTGSAAFKDLPPLGFRRMLCVEAAAIGSPVTVKPGLVWAGRQTLVAM
ncbi:MAG: D-hexose-6-phosphate mutarotase [Burkholderiales bacterium]|nr:D-hexose-6-phosphate mutarotase [Burkholderiales bacterium]